MEIRSSSFNLSLSLISSRLELKINLPDKFFASWALRFVQFLSNGYFNSYRRQALQTLQLTPSNRHHPNQTKCLVNLISADFQGLTNYHFWIDWFFFITQCLFFVSLVSGDSLGESFTGARVSLNKSFNLNELCAWQRDEACFQSQLTVANRRDTTIDTNNAEFPL